MKVLKEGKLNKRMAWFTTCSTCGSELRILQGDPMATKEVCYNCDASQYYVRYVCPVCRSLEKAYTNSSFGIKGNARYEEIVLNDEDRDELSENANGTDYLSMEEEWISNRFRV